LTKNVPCTPAYLTTGQKRIIVVRTLWEQKAGNSAKDLKYRENGAICASGLRQAAPTTDRKRCRNTYNDESVFVRFQQTQVEMNKS
jgi:hypothetical protein